MIIETCFASLPEMHPELEWQEIAAAAVSVLEDCGFESPFEVQLELIEMPGFGTEQVVLLIHKRGIPAERVARVRRTFDTTRRVELAAIAMTGLGLYHGGSHEIVDIAVRGSGADYLIDAAHHPCEIAGRSRQSDFAIAWQQRFERVSERARGGFYLGVFEFQSPTGKILFQAKTAET